MMKKYLAILLLSSGLLGCKSMVRSGVEADLAAVSITLNDEYEVTKVSKGLKNTSKTRSYTLHVSDRDATHIISDLTSCDCYDSSISSNASTEGSKQNKAYQTKKGYAKYVPDNGGAYRIVYIDTTSDELHVSYNGMLF